MKILKILLYLLLGLGALWLILALFATNSYRIERQIQIDAPYEMVYEQARYFENLPNWSPWQHLDPNMETSVDGTDGEVGAVYSWSGNDDVGSGTQTITALTADRIDIEVVLKGWMETAFPTYMTFEAGDSLTTVNWVADFYVSFPWNGLAMFTDIDAAIGKDYASGLENLKVFCEDLAHPKYRGYEVAETMMPQKYYIGQRGTMSFADVPAFYAEYLPKSMEAVQANEATLLGSPSGLYWSFDTITNMSDMAAGIPIQEQINPGSSLQLIPVDSGQALVINYYGAYGESAEAHYAMDDYMNEKGLQNIPPVIEEYVTDPEQEPDTAKWLTRIIYYVEPKPVVDSLAQPEG